MKKLILICLVLLLTGCVAGNYVEQPSVGILGLYGSGRLDIGRWHDETLEVTCWIVDASGGTGMSCLPDWMLEPQKCE